jgi:hypothetical protein
MSVIGSNILAGASGQGGAYNLTNSLRFRSSASATLSRTPASATNRRTWTFSAWVKRGKLTSNNTIFNAGYPTVSWFAFIFGNNDTLQIAQTAGSSAGWSTAAVFRDCSAWYHVVCVIDTTSATSTITNTATDRIRLYVNNVQQSLSGGTVPTQNSDLQVNNTISHTIGGYSAEYFDGYMAEVNFVDGQALTPSSFGETSTTTGVWIPKKYTGTYGTNGFYLPFTNTASTSTLGNDFSGNSNTWTVNNISLTAGSTYDSMTDVPTLTSATAANYATLNPLNPSGGTYADGNLQWVSATTDGRFALSTFDITTSGKWYCEVTIGAKSGTYWTVGAMGSPITFNPRMQYRSDGVTNVNGTTGSTFASFTTGDVIGMAFDASTNQITFYKNNTSQGTLTATTTGVSYYFGCGSDNSGSTSTYNINFGQRPFAYTPPTGFVALNTFNLPTPTIGATASTTANKYMDATLYTGNNSTNNIVNAAGFKPDMVWLKGRSQSSNHIVQDSVRGANTYLLPNLTGSEGTDGSLTSFNSNGFSLTTDAGVSFNANGTTYVGWQWRASNATAVTNTAGTITSTVSANTTAGFSVVTYTASSSASTIGHGLGVAPSMIIQKNRDATSDWGVYHVSVGATKFLKLNTSDTPSTNSVPWNDTAPTSTVFSIGTGYTNGNKYVAYCFAQVAGYSAFGSYTGNGSTDGTFVYLGFRPKYILIKQTNTSGEGWFIFDTSRSPYNVQGTYLTANASEAENTLTDRQSDILSNGIKFRGSHASVNGSGSTYIYMAFAENPFKYANAR